MRKKVILSLVVLIVIFSYLTIVSATKAFRLTSDMPTNLPSAKDSFRLVLITQELDTPFWNKVGQGAIKQAQEENVQLEVWGSYGNNQDDFLKKMEIAIHSKVNGIIVQGLDNEEFKELTKVKAAFYGIPVITVANDVPVQESLRKTYVGSDQFLAGKLVASQLIKEMGTAGEVIILGDQEQAYYQKERLAGIRDVLDRYPDIEIFVRGTAETKEQVLATTQQLMNEVPQASAFIAINANHVGPMIQEIERRTQVEPYHIFTFDDGVESAILLKQGKLDGVLEQMPEEMGRDSVKLLVEWITDETVPLDSNGYLTETRIVKAKGDGK
ncbi:substrate-binding domain-containing protein [Psychrobacillus sp. FJAT-21963]|uniref:substrate-binding domain-containing protein n=1 Tax=Psychrobacillus sp. FJAT-21963 TaxID=1712028 RepID=UPI0006F1D0FA|nr:substrate-binding domain-containing protein [Psychrobacillus sp. FJAT-21963]KQL32593.1 sugar ABC transporter substrate-binding protein [Psychrobacillus sp. FJAT-21963]